MNTKTVLRWAFILACLFVVGPLCSAAMASVRDADGGHAVSMLVGGGGARSLLAGLLVLVGAAIVGWVGAHFFALSTGFGCSGLVLAWGAWRTGTFDDVVRRTHSGAELSRLMMECAIVMILTACIAALMWRTSKRRQPSVLSPRGAGARSILSMLASSKDEGEVAKLAGVSVIVGAAACAVVAWIVAVTMLKGQAVFASFAGAIGAGVVAQFVASSMRGHATPVGIVLAMMIPAVAGPLLAMRLSDPDLVAQTYANTVVPLARVMPLDWAAGALLGAPIGLGWAGAMMDARVV